MEKLICEYEGRSLLKGVGRDILCMLVVFTLGVEQVRDVGCSIIGFAIPYDVYETRLCSSLLGLLVREEAGVSSVWGEGVGEEGGQTII